jgi:hypothetical protein
MRLGSTVFPVCPRRAPLSVMRVISSHFRSASLQILAQALAPKSSPLDFWAVLRQKLASSLGRIDFSRRTHGSRRFVGETLSDERRQPCHQSVSK